MYKLILITLIIFFNAGNLFAQSSIELSLQDGTVNSFTIGDTIYLNACGNNPENYEINPFKVSNKIIEVPNIIMGVEDSPYGRPITTEASSTIILDGDKKISALIENFRNLTIKNASGKVLLEKKISGATSLYEIKINNKTIAWGVGWHKHCHEKYFTNADFTILRVILPTLGLFNKVKVEQELFKGIAETSFKKLLTNMNVPLLIGASTWYGTSNAMDRYYSIPVFYKLDNKKGFQELKDSNSLKEAGINYLDIDPIKYINWLSEYASKSGDTNELKNYIVNNFDQIIDSAYDQRDFDKHITGKVTIKKLMSRKKKCLSKIKNNKVNTLKKIGELCLPEFEKANYFNSRYDKE